jgi:hypothetical protein
MAWSPTSPPKRGGSYSRFVIKRAATLPKSTRGIVAMPIVHDWGPLKTFVDVESLAEFIDIFGVGGDPTTNTYTPGFLAVYNAFKGSGADDPGASRLILYRMGNGAVKQNVTISNTAGTPVPALRVRGRYEGDGPDLAYSIALNAADPTNKHDFVIYVNGTEVERFAYLKTDLAALATAVNKTPTPDGKGGSGWVTMDGPGGAAVVTGTALAVTAKTNLTGGLNGITGLVAQDWTDMRNAYAPKSFEVFVPYDNTDTTIATAMASWASLQNEPLGPTRSKRFMYCEGGGNADDVTAALLRSTTHNNPNVVNLGIGTYRDTVLNTVMNTSQLAPRMAGVIARRGFGSSIFCTHLDDLEIVTGPTDTDILSAIDGGVVVLGLDSVGVRFENSVTSYISDSDDKPKWAYGVIKYVVTMQQIETAIRLRQESGNKIGRLNVNDDTRETILGDAQEVLDEFIALGGIQPGARVLIAQDPPPSDDQSFIGLDYPAKFARTLDQVRNTFYLS